MRNIYRGPSRDASYQVLILLVKQFKNIIFLQKLTNHKQELPMTVMFVNGSV
jgi:hypothetical protein